jgi:hypothetical protein
MWGSGGIALQFYLGKRWKFVSFRPDRLTLREMATVSAMRLGGGLDTVEKRETLPLPGIELRYARSRHYSYTAWFTKYIENPWVMLSWICKTCIFTASYNTIFSSSGTCSATMCFSTCVIKPRVCQTSTASHLCKYQNEGSGHMQVNCIGSIIITVIISRQRLAHRRFSKSSQSQSYITADGQSASLSCCQATIWDPRQIFLLLSLIILDRYWFV